MRNLVKVLGIIAMLAVIGVFISCGDVAPEDQTLITITEIPSAFEGFYASVTVSDKLVNDPSYKIIATSYLRKISGGSVTCDMKDEEDKAAIVESGYVIIAITKKQTDKETVYVGSSTSAITLGKSAQDKTTTQLLLVPDINDGAAKYLANNASDAAAPDTNSFGTYITKVNLAGATYETINFSKNTFDIFDSTGDSFTFTIEKWENATTPAAPTDLATGYPTAYKFTGKITAAKKAGTKIQKGDTNKTANYGYFNSGNTAPSIYPSDMDAGTPVTMYLYCSKPDETTGEIKFVRSPFSKDGSKKDPIPASGDANNPTAVSGLRIYEKI